MRKGTRKRVRGLIKRGHTALQCGGMETRASQRHVPCRDRPEGARWHRVWNRYGRASRLQEGGLIEPAEQRVEYLWRGEEEHQESKTGGTNVGHKCKDTDG